MNGASTTAPSCTRGSLGVPPPPLFHVVSSGSIAAPQPVPPGQNVVEFVFPMVRPEFQPPIVNRNPAIVAAPAPPTGADEIVVSVPRSPVALAGVNEPAVIPDWSESA